MRQDEAERLEVEPIEGPPDQLDEGDCDPGDWRCELCGSINSRIDGDCQFCDGPDYSGEEQAEYDCEDWIQWPCS